MFSVPILTNCSIRRPIIKIRLITRAANLIIKRHEILKLREELLAEELLAATYDTYKSFFVYRDVLMKIGKNVGLGFVYSEKTHRAICY